MLSIWTFFANLFGLGQKDALGTQVYEDIKEKSETKSRDNQEDDIEKGYLDRARERIYSFLRRPRDK